jgi:hypothetical protein
VIPIDLSGFTLPANRRSPLPSTIRRGIFPAREIGFLLVKERGELFLFKLLVILFRFCNVLKKESQQKQKKGG